MKKFLRVLKVSVPLLALVVAAPALAQKLPPSKDRLFAYPKTLESEYGGDYRVIDYNEMRDLQARDAVPQRRAESRYVSLGVRQSQQDLVAPTTAGNIPHYAVGKTAGARVIVVYLHGQGGSRHQGVDDYTFGGNFNRIKALAVAGGGLYLSPDFSDFNTKGSGQVAALIDHYSKMSPRAKVFVACGSSGGGICWRLARDPSIAPRLGGLLLLGSFPDESFLSSEAFRLKVPLLLAQGSKDRVFPVDRTKAFFEVIRNQSPGYPVKMLRFETGVHGTPIRMVDWRETINWMLSR